MNNKLLISTLAIAVLFNTATIAGPVVNGVAISDSRIDQIMKQLSAAQPGQVIDPQVKKEIIEQLVVGELLRQEAQRQKLDKSADYLTQLENVQSMLLAQRLVEDYQRANPVTPAQLKEEYEKYKSEFPKKKSYHAHHILVATESEANTILAALEKGKPFAKLAEEKSLDTGSKKQGGDLGWFDPSVMVPEFAKAVTHLAKGQITQKPVETKHGWHIIRLDDVRVEQAPSMETVKPQLTQRLMGQRIQKLIDELRAKAKITQ